MKTTKSKLGEVPVVNISFLL